VMGRDRWGCAGDWHRVCGASERKASFLCRGVVVCGWASDRVLSMNVHSIVNEKALGETQTLRAVCSKAEPKIVASPQYPSRGRGTAKI